MGDKMLKRSYNHECARPLFAIMNPELTYSLPAFQTAAPGADIMMHTMERYFTREQHTELTDKISEGLLRTVKTMVLEALANPTSYTARANLLLAGSKSHDGLTGLGCIGDFACHAIEHELGAMFDVAHGAGLTAIWSSWAKYVIDVKIPRASRSSASMSSVSRTTIMTPRPPASAVSRLGIGGATPSACLRACPSSASTPPMSRSRRWRREPIRCSRRRPRGHVHGAPRRGYR